MVLLLTLLALDAGKLIERVETTADPSQSYAIYLPSNYSADRTWPLLMAFDPAARGRVPVERFQAAAETYGYIVAGSNNSRNGSWERSLAAVQAMWNDVNARFKVDATRVYTTGFSGGSRVALSISMGTKGFAGVIACSAGFPDGKPARSAPIPIFGTAGSEDFNYLEMRRLDRALTTPHRVAIFEGRHAWPPAELAMEAIEWMELQAVKSGLRAKDAALIEKLLSKRVAQAEALVNEKQAYLAWSAIAADFEGLRDVTAMNTRAAELGTRKSVKDALKREREEEDREEQLTSEVAAIENTRELRSALLRLKKRFDAAEDSPDRRVARRVLYGLRAQGMAGNDAMRKLMNEILPR
jgi:predicted esterase